MNEKILEIVKKSPQLVKSHQREEWVQLFSKDAEIEDPVGSRPYKQEELGKFWDAFIAPNEITFHSNFDILSGNTVARDVNIHTILPSKHEVWVPAHLFYTVKDGKVISMYAHWDLSKMVFDFLKMKGAISAMTSLSFSIFKNLGIPGIWGFTKAFLWGIKGSGEKIIKSQNLANHLKKDADLNFSLNDLSNIKVLNTRSSGYYTSFSFEKEGKKGIGNLKFCPLSKNITWGRLYH
jgi:hypothetical protein